MTQSITESQGPNGNAIMFRIPKRHCLYVFRTLHMCFSEGCLLREELLSMCVSVGLAKSPTFFDNACSSGISEDVLATWYSGHSDPICDHRGSQIRRQHRQVLVLAGRIISSLTIRNLSSLKRTEVAVQSVEPTSAIAFNYSGAQSFPLLVLHPESIHGQKSDLIFPMSKKRWSAVLVCISRQQELAPESVFKAERPATPARASWHGAAYYNILWAANLWKLADHINIFPLQIKYFSSLMIGKWS